MDNETIKYKCMAFAIWLDDNCIEQVFQNHGDNKTWISYNEMHDEENDIHSLEQCTRYTLEEVYDLYESGYKF